MKLPKELTTVTPLSKTIALVLFMLLPFLGFLIGFKYQEGIMREEQMYQYQHNQLMSPVVPDDELPFLR